MRGGKRRPGGGFSDKQQAEFVGMVHAYFEAQGVEAVFEDGYLVVKTADSPLVGRPLGLDNLAQMCALSDKSEWSELIAAQFDSMRSAVEGEEELERMLGDYSAVRHMLAVRLWPPVETLADFDAEHLVYREDLEGTISVLVLDLPTTLMTVLPEHVAAWGRPKEELFELALDNVRRLSSPEMERLEVGGGVEVLVLSDDSLLVTSNALRLDEFPECVGVRGALVGVPNRQALLCYPMDDQKAMQAVGPMAFMISGMFAEGPGSISDSLYWFHDGKYTRLPYELKKKGMDFFPPEDFVAALEGLA